MKLHPQLPLNGHPAGGQRWNNAWLALAIGVAGVVVYLGFNYVMGYRSDLEPLLAGARALLDGQNPYAAIRPGPGLPWGYPLYYPLPALVLVLPFALLPAVLAHVLFAGLSFGLLGYGILRTGRHRLPMLLSWPVLYAVAQSQWSPLLTAAYLLPWLALIWAAKPNFALPFLVARPTRRMLVAFGVGGVVLAAVSFALMPGWLAEWLAVAQHAVYIRPLLLAPFGGFLLALALLRWRDADARLLFGLACVPQTAWTYNGVPVYLLASTTAESWHLVLLGWLAGIGQTLLAYWAQDQPVPVRYEIAIAATLALFYLPALWLVLRRDRMLEGERKWEGTFARV